MMPMPMRHILNQVNTACDGSGDERLDDFLVVVLWMMDSVEEEWPTKPGLNLYNACLKNIWQFCERTTISVLVPKRLRETICPTNV
jgi:hypothetical protein